MARPANRRSRGLHPVVLAAMLLAVSPSGHSAGAQGFTPEQRNAIVSILRDAMKSDPSILREGIDSFQADHAGRKVNAARQFIAAQHDSIFNNNDPGAGSPDAPITLVEFFDTRCPY